jgi:tRNA 2-thiocytidine biosynthesis protein TtcA
MAFEKRILKIVGTTIVKYDLIEPNDKILIAFSGGKDSYTMLEILSLLLKNSPVKYELFPVIIDSGFNANYSKAEKYLKNQKISYLIEKTKIAEVVKSQIKNKNSTGNYCFLCSRLRRGILCKIAKENSCTKIALGHNLDDSIETFLMSMSYISGIETMLPKYKAKDSSIIIRPLINVPENTIRQYSKEKRFPIVKQKCLLKKKDSKRLAIKKLVAGLSKDNKTFYSSMANAQEKINALKKDSNTLA